jgi:hypothetical protein
LIALRMNLAPWGLFLGAQCGGGPVPIDSPELRVGPGLWVAHDRHASALRFAA